MLIEEQRSGLTAPDAATEANQEESSGANAEAPLLQGDEAAATDQLEAVEELHGDPAAADNADAEPAVAEARTQESGTGDAEEDHAANVAAVVALCADAAHAVVAALQSW